MGMLTDDDLTQLLSEAAGSYDVPDDGPAEVLAAQPAPAAPPRRLLALSAAAAVVALAVGGAVVLHGGDDARPSQLASAGGRAATGPESAARDDQRSGSLDSGAAAGAAASTTGSTASGDSAPLALPLPAAAAPTGALSDVLHSAAGPAAKGTAVPVEDDARVVKKGTIGLVVDDGQVTPTLTRVQDFATSMGGVIADQQSQEAGDTPSGSVTLRVPTDRFERLVQDVRTAAPEVSTATTSGQDVTAQYADTEAQIKTLTKARDRFLTILDRANSIGDVLSVQQRVDDVQGRIDRLEGQRKVLAAQSDTATLQVTVTERDDPTLVKVVAPESGLSKAVHDARDGFAHGVEALVRLSGPALLVVLLLALAYGVFRVGRRAVRRRLV